MSAVAPLPGFAEPVRDSQRVFRAVMSALAEPGTIRTLSALPAAPSPLGSTAAAVILALADYETPIWLSPSLRAEAVVGFLRFHTGAPVVVDPTRAVFALMGDATEFGGFDGFPVGTLDYPDRSATVLLQVDALATDGPLSLTGPGVPGTRRFGLAPMPVTLPAALAANRDLFPRGVDLLLAAPDRIAGLPRSTTVRVSKA